MPDYMGGFPWRGISAAQAQKAMYGGSDAVGGL
jgi:hypothetical protein